MAMVLKEWDRRCAQSYANTMPRCGTTQGLHGWLRASAIDLSTINYPDGDVSGAVDPSPLLHLKLTPGGSVLVTKHLELAARSVESNVAKNNVIGETHPLDETKVHTLEPGDSFLCYGTGTPAEGRHPADLLSDLGRLTKLPGTKHTMGLGFSSHNPVTETAVFVTFVRRLGGCGKTFGSGVAALKHMGDCCPDLIDPSVYDMDPIEAASKTLVLKSDEDSKELSGDKWPHGDPGWLCYLCGKRSVSHRSFVFHVTACKRDWDNEQLGKHPSRWKVPPSSPRPMAEVPTEYGPALQKYNAEASRVFDSMQPCCPNCGKSFGNEQSLTSHMKQCCPDVVEAAIAAETAERPEQGIPTGSICYLCGRRVGSFTSLPLHIRVCLRAWYRREKEPRAKDMAQPPSVRRPPPKPPSLPIPPPGTRNGSAEALEYSNEAQRIFETTLPKCPCVRQYPLVLGGGAFFSREGKISDHHADMQATVLDISTLVSEGRMAQRNADIVAARARQEVDDAHVVSALRHSLGYGDVVEEGAHRGKRRLQIVKKLPKAIAAKTGLKLGDVLLCIGEEIAPIIRGRRGSGVVPAASGVGGDTGSGSDGEGASDSAQEDANSDEEQSDPDSDGDGEDGLVIDKILKAAADAQGSIDGNGDSDSDSGGGRGRGSRGLGKLRPRLVWWWERVCGLVFGDQEKRDKHMKGCIKDFQALGASVKDAEGGAGDSPFQPAMERDLTVYKGEQSRIKVRGDDQSLHARGARERRQFDSVLAKENARLFKRLQKVESVLPIGQRRGTSQLARAEQGDGRKQRPVAKLVGVDKDGMRRIRSKRDVRKSREDYRVATENQRLDKALRYLYGRRMMSNGEFVGEDNAGRVTKYYEGYAKNKQQMLTVWDDRTKLYQADPAAVYQKGSKVKPPKSRTARGGTVKKTAPAPVTPKTLGLAQCTMCGRRAYFQADGGCLRNCEALVLRNFPFLFQSSKWMRILPEEAKDMAIGGCNNAFYCDDVCAIADWPDHSKVCGKEGCGDDNVVVTKVESPWIDTAAHDRARKALRRERFEVRLPSGQLETVPRELLVLPREAPGSGGAAAGGADPLDDNVLRDKDGARVIVYGGGGHGTRGAGGGGGGGAVAVGDSGNLHIVREEGVTADRIRVPVRARMLETALRKEDRTMREGSAGKMHAFKEGEHVLALYDGPLPIPNDAHEDEAFDEAATLLKARVRRLCRADPDTMLGTYELDYYTVTDMGPAAADDAMGDEASEGMEIRLTLPLPVVLDGCSADVLVGMAVDVRRKGDRDEERFWPAVVQRKTPEVLRSKPQVNHAVAFALRLEDAVPEGFTTERQVALSAALASSLGLDLSQIEIAGFAAGSLVVNARATELVDAEAAQATARSIEAKAYAGTLAGPNFGLCTVVYVAAEATAVEVACDAQYDVVYDSEKLQVGAKVLLKKIDYRGRVKVIPVLVEGARYRPSVQQMMGLLAGQTKIDNGFKDANPEEESDELGIVCYVCGARVMNLETYDAHLANCLTRWQRLEDKKDRSERRAPPKPPAEVPRPPALSDVEATVAYNDKVEEERVDDGSNPNGGGVPAAELELEERINLRTHRVQMEKVQQYTEEGLVGQVRELALAERMLEKHKGYKKPALSASAASYGVDGAAEIVGFGGGKGPPEQRTKLMETRGHRLYEERRIAMGGWVVGADEGGSALSAGGTEERTRRSTGGREGAYRRPKKEVGFRR